MSANGSARPAPAVHRGVRISPAATLHCALIATIAFLFVPRREILTRWRTTIPYLLFFGGYTLWFHLVGVPWVWAPIVAASTLFLAATAAMAGSMRWGSSDLWRVRAGTDGAVILTKRNKRKGRVELNTWATFRHRRGLGRLVLDAAWEQAPRPLWLNPATPSLRAFYLSQGAIADPDGSRWLVLREE